MLQHFFSVNSSNLDKCLYPGNSCTKKAIRAHTIQNSKILERIAKDGHVIGLKTKIDENHVPRIEFKPISRHKASTFTGLCGSHDRQLFEAIDTKDISQHDPKQLFLLAYRAVLRELHSTMDAAVKAQSTYHKRVELGLDPENQPSSAGIMAVERMMVAYETNCFKEIYDRYLLSESFSEIEHKILIFESQEPTVAASCMFSLDNLKVGDDVARVALNIIPLPGNIVLIVFSFQHEEASQVKSALNRIFNDSGEYQKYELSRMLLNHCENFVIAPEYYEKWSEVKKHKIEQFFYKTLFENDYSHQHEDLMLF